MHVQVCSTNNKPSRQNSVPACRYFSSCSINNEPIAFYLSSSSRYSLNLLLLDGVSYPGVIRPPSISDITLRRQHICPLFKCALFGKGIYFSKTGTND